MDIVELATYSWKWWYFALILFTLGLIAGSRANVSTPMLNSNSLHRTVGETFPTLYSRALVYFRSYMKRIVLLIAWLSAMYSLSVYLRYIHVWSCDFHITGNPKYDTRNPEQERAVSESSLDSSGNQLPLKSASAHTLTSLSKELIYMPIFQFPSSSALSSWQPYRVFFLDPRIITRIGAPRIQCLVEYSLPSS